MSKSISRCGAASPARKPTPPRSTDDPHPLGTLVGAGAGALFKVHFDADASHYAGLQLLCHPDEMVFLPK